MTCLRPARVILAAVLALGIETAAAQDYEPMAGDAVVISTSRFQPEHFEDAQQITVEAFGKAMEASGQTLRTFWIVDPESYEIVSISFFKAAESVGAWNNDEHRRKALDTLAPLRRLPQVQRLYTVIGTHSTK